MSAWAWEIPAAFRADMRVPARLYADDDLLEQALSDRSLEQLVNTATLPGIVRLCPGHARRAPGLWLSHRRRGRHARCRDGVISPGGVGYDINCGVRLLATRLRADERCARM